MFNRMVLAFKVVSLLFITTSFQPFLKAEVPEIPNLLPEGLFETKTGSFFTGWNPGGFIGGKPETTEMWGNTVTAEMEEGAVPFARINCKDPEGQNVGFSATEKLVINPEWPSLILKSTLRVREFVKGGGWGGRAQVTLTFFDVEAKALSGENFIGLTENVESWTEKELSIPVPKGAVSVQVGASVIGANGILDIKSIQLFPGI